MAAFTTLYLDQGSDFTANIDILQDDGTPFDLTGANVIAQMRRSYYSVSGYSFRANVANVQTGVVTLSLPGDTSANIRAGRYVFDILVAQYNSNTRVLEGTVVVYPQVSRK